MKIVRKNQFKKDYKTAVKQGRNINSLKEILEKLLNFQELDIKHKDHRLNGKYKESRECHITPDWLLIYTKKENLLILERMGSHSELFG